MLLGIQMALSRQSGADEINLLGVNAVWIASTGVSTATSDLVTREDLATLTRLQEEFAAELATLRGRVDAWSKCSSMEAQQFPPLPNSLESCGWGGRNRDWRKCGWFRLDDSTVLWARLGEYQLHRF